MIINRHPIDTNKDAGRFYICYLYFFIFLFILHKTRTDSQLGLITCFAKISTSFSGRTLLSIQNQFNAFESALHFIDLCEFRFIPVLLKLTSAGNLILSLMSNIFTGHR